MRRTGNEPFSPAIGTVTAGTSKIGLASDCACAVRVAAAPPASATAPDANRALRSIVFMSWLRNQVTVNGYLPPVPYPGKLTAASPKKKARHARAFCARKVRRHHHLTSAGNFPPLAASFVITCLCSQMFMVAESLVSPVYPSSFARSLRAARLESMSSAFIRSTIDVRQASFSCLAATALSRIGATSTVCAGAVEADDDPPPGAAPGPAVAPPLAGVASAEWPKIALMIFPKMLIVHS